MFELLAALIETLVSAFVALLSLCADLTIVLLESLGFVVGSLAEKPAEGKSRLSAARLLAAFAPLLLLVVIVIAAYQYFTWRSRVDRERHHAALAIIRDELTELGGDVDDAGHYIQHAGPELDTIDPWGSQLVVEYRETVLSENVTVISAGRDRTFQTLDDLKASHSQLRRKREIAAESVERAKDALKQRIGRNP